MTAERQAVSLVCALYGLLVVPLAFWPAPLEIGPLLAYALCVCLALGLAIELAETLLALSWPRHLPLCSNEPPVRRTVAVVMTVCDDWTNRSLEALLPLADAGYTVFVLDDSAETVTLPLVVSGRVQLLRRERRNGAKGGNLNHWLRQHGERFDYAIVLDADSRMCVRTADTLLGIAEHKANCDVAIVQSKTETDMSTGTVFARAIGGLARPRARVLERVHCRLGLLLSFGHGQLLRLEAVSAVGGFDETLTNEDTVLSLRLAARSWRCVLADAWSCDADPDTIASYNRRTVRWARQTLELFNYDWRGVPLPLKLLLCRHLMTYFLPLVGTCLLAVSLWTGPENPVQVLLFLGKALRFHSGFELVGVALWTSIGSALALFVGRIVVARQEGVAWTSIVAFVFVGGAHYPSVIVPLAVGLVSSALGRPVRFIPTNNRRALAHDAQLRSRVSRGLSTGALMTLLVAGAVKNPGAVLVGFNCVWLAWFLISPLVSWVLGLLGPGHVVRTQSPAHKVALRV